VLVISGDSMQMRHGWGSCLTLSPLSSQSMGSPDSELPDTTLFLTFFFSKFSSRYFGFTGINQRHAGRYFGFTGICNGRRSQFLALWGERVNVLRNLSGCGSLRTETEH